MGEVYRARHARLNRGVAIKVIPSSVADNPETLARFERESHAIADLSHPNILTIFEVGHSNGHPYAVMELLNGETLRVRIAGGPLPVRKAIDIAAQIACSDKHDVGTSQFRVLRTSPTLLEATREGSLGCLLDGIEIAVRSIVRVRG